VLPISERSSGSGASEGELRERREREEERSTEAEELPLFLSTPFSTASADEV